MAKITWGDSGSRFFEAGLDRGVFYPQVGPGVPWNGLVTVTESTDGGETRPYYLDGLKVMNLTGFEEFKASVESFYMPEGFEKAIGSQQVSPGLFATQQPRQSFSFAYRTRIGNDISTDIGYKIHLVYNALAAPSDVTRATLSEEASLTTMSWELSTLPPYAAGMRPTAHFVIDTRKAPGAKVISLENILYGTSSVDPRMITVSELITLFGS